MRAHFLIALGIIAGAGCATAPQTKPPSPDVSAADANAPGMEAFEELEKELSQKQKQESIADPLEPVNRFMFGVNDVLYFWVVKPIAETYAKIAPKPVRLGIRNFFHNVGTPSRLVNCLLQGKNTAAGTEVQRFVVNTTVGVLGFGDPAYDRWGLKPAEEDLGQTLGVYGFRSGPYLVLPFIGPYTARDALAMLGDQFLYPVRYIEPREVSIALSAVRATNAGSFHLGEYESFKAAAVDPYVAMREAYVQYRNRQIRDQDQPPDPNRGGPQMQ